jgi:hypothetical protein
MTIASGTVNVLVGRGPRGWDDLVLGADHGRVQWMTIASGTVNVLVGRGPLGWDDLVLGAGRGWVQWMTIVSEAPWTANVLVGRVPVVWEDLVRGFGRGRAQQWMIIASLAGLFFWLASAQPLPRPHIKLQRAFGGRTILRLSVFHSSNCQADYLSNLPWGPS